MTKTNRYSLMAAAFALIGLNATAGTYSETTTTTTHHPLHHRDADLSGTAPGYDTDRSGWANRQNNVARETVNTHDGSHRYEYTARGQHLHDTDLSGSANIHPDFRGERRVSTTSTTRTSPDYDSDLRVRDGYDRDSKTTTFSASETSDNRGPAYSGGVGYSADSDRDRVSVTTTQSGADNTGLNKRDRDESAKTADKQMISGGKSDVELTRQIRRELRNDDSLSSYGKNVKIITKNGETTLRGPVHSSEEKDKIEDAAERIVGTNRVINELEIKH